MTAAATPSPTPAAPTPPDRWRRWRAAGHALAVAVVVAGVLALLVRPTAPPIEQPLPATRWFDADFLDLAARYQRPRDVAAVIAVVVKLAFLAALAVSPPGRRLVGRVADRLGHRPWLAAAVVAGGAVVLLDVLLLPVAFWSGYVHDGAFGLRTHGLGGWLRDWAAFRAPGWVGASAVAAVGFALARRCPRGWPPLLAGLGAVAVAAVVAGGPLVLEPLAHRTWPLPAGPTREAVAGVVDRSGVRLDTILVADASRRTVRENAYVSGLGTTRRMVLYDTLVQSRTPEEIRAIVAHELAHHRHRDVERGTLAGMAAVVAATYALAWWLRWRTRRGRQREVADPRAAGVVVAVVLLAALLATPVESAASRRVEAAADWAALELTDDPAAYEALKVDLARRNLSGPDPPWWRHLWWGTHPTPVERLTMAERWRAAQP